MRTRALAPLVAGALFLAAACGETAPRSGPGTMLARIVSPNGAEGSAMVELFGPGIGEIGSLEGRVFSERRGDTVRVVVVRDGNAGDLRFTLAVLDTTQLFTGTVLEVAGPDDALRSTVSTYAVDVSLRAGAQ